MPPKRPKKQARILATYVTLNDRDPSYIHWCWTAILILCMASLIVTGLFSTTSNVNIYFAFDSYCMFIENVSFIERNQTTEWYEDFRASINESIRSALIEEDPKEESIAFIYQRKRLARNSTENETTTQMPDTDYLFLVSMQVDTFETNWGEESLCEYSLYYPLWSLIIAVFFIILVLVFRMGGLMDDGIPQSWRILLPEQITCIIMVILSIIYNILIERGYNKLCAGLASQLESKKIECWQLINALCPYQEAIRELPGTSYSNHLLFSRLTTIIWTITSLLLFVRVIFVIDFQVVRVVVYTFSENINLNEVKSLRNRSLKLKPDAADDVDLPPSPGNEPTAGPSKPPGAAPSKPPAAAPSKPPAAAPSKPPAAAPSKPPGGAAPPTTAPGAAPGKPPGKPPRRGR